MACAKCFREVCAIDCACWCHDTVKSRPRQTQDPDVKRAGYVTSRVLNGCRRPPKKLPVIGANLSRGWVSLLTVTFGRESCTRTPTTTEAEPP